MTAWPKDELQKIASTDDLHIASLREDGWTPTLIWSITVDGTLYRTPRGLSP